MYERRLKEISQRLERIDKVMMSLVDGHLLCKKHRNSFQYYKSNGQNPIYIPRSQEDIARQLAMRQFYEIEKQQLLSEKQAIEKYLTSNQKILNKYSSILDKESPQNQLRYEYLNKWPKTLEDWINEEYEQSNEYPEYKINPTLKGDMVRSKAERDIANYLFQHQIPYRYECKLIIDGIAYYPDFTIHHPTKTKIIYWEHFGLMDDPDYIRKTFNKQKVYADYNIIPTFNLITTYETKRNPFDSMRIPQIVQEFFYN